MQLYRKYKNYILSAVIVVALFVLYSLLFDGDDKAILSSESSGPDTTVEQELLATLLELRSIQFNDNVFRDQAFRSLRDYGQPLTPQPVGRNNPFAPLGENQ